MEFAQLGLHPLHLRGQLTVPSGTDVGLEDERHARTDLRHLLAGRHAFRESR